MHMYMHVIVHDAQCTCTSHLLHLLSSLTFPSLHSVPPLPPTVLDYKVPRLMLGNPFKTILESPLQCIYANFYQVGNGRMEEEEEEMEGWEGGRNERRHMVRGRRGEEGRQGRDELGT